jgi:hypothetical protein
VDDIRKVFADFTPSDIRQLELLMKKAGLRAEALSASSGGQPVAGKRKS